ncbi:MAG TPA: hypothetical protein PK595_06265 [Bacteroidota bacterium]|nr:hypothetical protein [Bacteroidota bacterium]
MSKLFFQIFLFLLLIVTFCGCVATSNYYSGRTLEKNKLLVGVGADEIAIISTNKDITVSRDSPFMPSIMFAYGLPLRLEAGLRYSPTHFLEGTLREQLNPRSFDIFDCSLNLSYAALIGGYSYLKYGATVSKNLKGFEPYVHYASYHFMGATKDDFVDSFISSMTDEFFNNNHSIGCGIIIPLIQGARICPEANYQYYGNRLSDGLWHFGIAIRIQTN